MTLCQDLRAEGYAVTHTGADADALPPIAARVQAVITEAGHD
jgi:hypothetical protein